jgi:heparan-sulfate lyase
LGVITNFQTIYNVAKANDRLKDFDPEYAEKMRLACLFIANFIWPDYTWEWFNDTFRQTKNVLLRTIKSYSAMFPEENLLKYLASERKEGTAPTESLISFSNGGYYILRSGWDGNETMFILKNNFNPQNEAHCHMDNGTFALWSK